MPNSLLDEKCIFDEANWVVSSCSYGLPGHAKIVIERLIRNPISNNSLYILNEYHIGYHETWPDRYVVQDDESRFTETEYAVAINSSFSSLSHKQSIGLKVYYQGTTCRCSCLPKIEVQKIIDSIHQEKSLNDHYFKLKKAAAVGGTIENETLQAWVRLNYEPIYAVISPTEGDDMTQTRTNCATWVNRKLRRYGLATSLPTSSGGSVPVVMAHRWSGYDTGRLILGVTAVTLGIVASFWWFKPPVETASLALKKR